MLTTALAACIGLASLSGTSHSHNNSTNEAADSKSLAAAVAQRDDKADQLTTRSMSRELAAAGKPIENAVKYVPTQPAPVADLDAAQTANAAAIINAAKDMGLGKDAQVVAMATAMAESNLYNLASTAIPESQDYPNQGVGSDYDSVGLFQQRTSTGWGAVKDLMDPKYATRAFLGALLRVDGWQGMPVTVAAQTVQVSAFPDAYARHEDRARTVVDALDAEAR